jgi:tRNA (guanine-N7-)-methyltransferase
MKKIRPTQHCITLKDGHRLPFHNPIKERRELSLSDYVPENFQSLEVEIGCGKGEFISRRALKYPERFFIGIDRRKDRHTLTYKKLLRSDQKNWLILHEDARCFLESSLPQIQILHIYHPDPWPKEKHHKHRFFRSPDALKWAQAIRPGGELRLSTDHREYFEEILKILETWDFLEQQYVYTKRSGEPMTHFEGIFLKKNEPVYKAIYYRKK